MPVIVGHPQTALGGGTQRVVRTPLQAEAERKIAQMSQEPDWVTSCPNCHKNIPADAAACPECGWPIQADHPKKSRAEKALASGGQDRKPSVSFGRFCLGVGMFVSVLSCIATPLVGMKMAASGEPWLAILFIPLGMCLAIAQYHVFRKVRELYDFRPSQSE